MKGLLVSKSGLHVAEDAVMRSCRLTVEFSSECELVERLLTLKGAFRCQKLIGITQRDEISQTSTMLQFALSLDSDAIYLSGAAIDR